MSLIYPIQDDITISVRTFVPCAAGLLPHSAHLPHVYPRFTWCFPAVPHFRFTVDKFANALVFRWGLFCRKPLAAGSHN